jgi:hypothetical protein
MEKLISTKGKILNADVEGLVKEVKEEPKRKSLTPI